VATMKNVPSYARVAKSEYRRTRNFVAYTARTAGFDEVGLWNLVIETLEKRHTNFTKGKAKTDMTLVEAADKICKQAVKEREKMIAEQTAEAGEREYDMAGGHA
jgi:hypothetical protein